MALLTTALAALLTPPSLFWRRLYTSFKGSRLPYLVCAPETIEGVHPCLNLHQSQVSQKMCLADWNRTGQSTPRFSKERAFPLLSCATKTTLHDSPLANMTKAISLFDNFILRVSNIEEMHCLSSKLISGYQQELEKLRRPSLDESSAMVKDLLKGISSVRVTRYQEAGCRHVQSDQQAFVKLNVFMKGLNEHILRAQGGLDQLRKLVEEVTVLMDVDLVSTRGKELANKQLDENAADVNQEQCLEETTVCPWRTSDYALLMCSILSMLEKDLELQELVVGDLSLGVDSDRLQTYCQMWSLRPFVDDALLHQALGWAHK